MKILQGIPINRITSIDIETVRIADNFEDLDEGTQSAWEYKNKQDGEIPEYEELKEKWAKSASLYAEFSKVCAVSISFLHNNVLNCKEFYGENEEALLKALAVSLNNMEAVSKDYRLVGHASKYFDYPFLCKRYIINNLEIPFILDTTLNKPWENKNLCTNELWKVSGTGSGSSLQALCNVLKIPTSKTDLVGDAVGKAYFDGELERIGRYCSLDTIATFNVIMRFKREKTFSFSEVHYVTAYCENILEPFIAEEEIEQPLPVKLFNLKQLTVETLTELKAIIKKKKPTKKDKEIILEIIKASLSDIDPNFGKVKNEVDVNKIIEQLKTEI